MGGETYTAGNWKKEDIVENLVRVNERVWLFKGRDAGPGHEKKSGV